MVERKLHSSIISAFKFWNVDFFSATYTTGSILNIAETHPTNIHSHALKLYRIICRFTAPDAVRGIVFAHRFYSLPSFFTVIHSWPQSRHYSTPRRGIAPLVCVATPVFLPSFTPHSEPSGSQEGIDHGTFQPCAGASVASVFSHIKPEPATVIILRPVVLALPTGRADGRIYRFTKPLEPQNFPWARRNAHVECVRRIELPPSDWKSEVLPLNYTHMFPIAKLPSLEHRNL